MMVLELRLAMECNVCEMLVDSVPEALRPRDALTGQIHLGLCRQLGICPVCFTEIDVPLDNRKWRRIMRRRSRVLLP